MKLTHFLESVEVAWLEGGNVFTGTERATDKILRENIEPTIKEFEKNFKLAFPKVKLDFSDTEKVARLGSVGKKEVSGDIDLGIDLHEFLNKDGQINFKMLGLDQKEFDTTFNLIKSRAKTASDKQIMVRSLLTLISNKINDSQEEIHSSSKDVTTASIFSSFPQYDTNGNKIPNKYVQIDLNVGPLQWLKFSYYSTGSFPGNLKGLHRTQLIAAVFDALGMTFKHESGVFDKERNIVATTVDEVIQLFAKHGIKIKPEDIYDFDKMLDAVDKSPLKDTIYEKYLKGRLDNMRDADIPDRMHDWWLENRDRIGMRGLWLPESSKLLKRLPKEEVDRLKAERESKDAEKIAKNQKKVSK